MTLEPNLKPPFCSEHHILMVWGETEMKFEEDGVEIIVHHIPAWICPHRDDVVFAPGVVGEAIETIHELARVIKQARATPPPRRVCPRF